MVTHRHGWRIVIVGKVLKVVKGDLPAKKGKKVKEREVVSVLSFALKTSHKTHTHTAAIFD